MRVEKKARKKILSSIEKNAFIKFLDSIFNVR